MGYYTTRIHITLANEHVQILDELALQHLVPRSIIIRWMIFEYLENRKTNPQKTDEMPHNWYNF